MRRWLGLKDLVVDAIEATTHIVQETQTSVTRNAVSYVKWIAPLAAPAQVVETAQRLRGRADLCDDPADPPRDRGAHRRGLSPGLGPRPRRGSD